MKTLHPPHIPTRVRNRFYQLIGKIGHRQYLEVFSKQLAQPVILKTDLNQLVGMVPNFSGSFRQYILSNFCTKQSLW